MANTNTDGKKSNWLTKVWSVCKKLVVRVGRSFKDMYSELKKVTWPQRGDLINTTLLVLAFMVVLGVVIFVIDAGSGALVQWITK
jgi:preprotein translocase subunit SecE